MAKVQLFSSQWHPYLQVEGGHLMVTSIFLSYIILFSVIKKCQENVLYHTPLDMHNAWSLGNWYSAISISRKTVFYIF